MLPRKIFENLIVIYVMQLLGYSVFFYNFLTKFSLKCIASNFKFNTTILWAPTNVSPPTGGTELRRCFDTALPKCSPRYKKHAKNITIHLQCLSRLSGEDAAVLGKQVFMFDEKKI